MGRRQYLNFLIFKYTHPNNVNFNWRLGILIHLNSFILKILRTFQILCPNKTWVSLEKRWRHIWVNHTSLTDNVREYHYNTSLRERAQTVITWVLGNKFRSIISQWKNLTNLLEKLTNYGSMWQKEHLNISCFLRQGTFGG